MAVTLLGVRIDTDSTDAILAKIRQWFSEPYARYIVTPNPEILVGASRDPYFREVLNQSDLSVCDGRGIELFTRGQTPRLPGVDLVHILCAEAAEGGHTVALLGDDTPRAELAKQALEMAHPGLRVVAALAGPYYRTTFQDGVRRIIPTVTEDEERVIDTLIATAPALLIVGFRHGVQEKWISEHLSELPSVRIAIGVGGTINFLSGHRQRAPQWMRRAGIEWFWRLLLEPRRLPRICRAVILFPLLVYRERFFSHQ